MDNFVTGNGFTSRENDPDFQTGRVLFRDEESRFHVGDSFCLGRYRILEYLGSGNFEVYKVLSPEEKIYAIKVFFLEEHAQWEFKVLSDLKGCPNIVDAHLVDSDVSKGVHLLVLEYIEGQILSKDAMSLFKDEKIGDGERDLKQKVLCMLINCVCVSLLFAHQNSIIHGDLKPSNIMLCEDGVKVLDFGTAQYLEVANRTSSNPECLGTVIYQAPEQLFGGELTPATDFYAFASVLFQLLTGKPFIGMVMGEFENLTSNLSGIIDCSEMKLVLQKNLSQDPQNRSPNAETFRKDLLFSMGLSRSSNSGTDIGANLRRIISRFLGEERIKI